MARSGYATASLTVDSLVHGAGHEHGRRAGPENVPYATGLGRAATLCAERLEDEQPRLRGLRDRLHRRLAEAVPVLTLNGHPRERLPNTLNVSFPDVDGERLLAAAPDVAASTGSACHAGRTEPSAVLTAMGVPAERALGAVRLTVGRWSSEEEVAHAGRPAGLAGGGRSGDAAAALGALLSAGRGARDGGSARGGTTRRRGS
jgi:cysteine desulfurase